MKKIVAQILKPNNTPYNFRFNLSIYLVLHVKFSANNQNDSEMSFLIRLLKPVWLNNSLRKNLFIFLAPKISCIE